MSWITRVLILSAALLCVYFVFPNVAFCGTDGGSAVAQDDPQSGETPKKDIPKEGKPGKKPQEKPKMGPKIKLKKPEDGQAQPRSRRPNPTPIPEITEYRKEPLDFITGFENRPILDLDNVDYNADVVAMVNGYKITHDEFKKSVVDSCGFLELKRLTTSILTERMQKELIAGGADPAQFEVSDEMIDNEINNLVMLEKQQDRTGKFDEKIWREMIDKSYGWENFRTLQRTFLAFGKVYLPVIEPGSSEAKPADDLLGVTGEAQEVPLDPALPVGQDAAGKDVNIHMPMHTWKVLSGTEMNMNIRDSLNEAYRTKRPLGNFVRPQYIQSIESAVVASTKIDYHHGGKLPADVYMRIADRSVKVDEIYPLVVAGLRDEDMRQVLSEIMVYKCLDQAIEKGGWALSGEKFNEEFTKHEKEFEGTLFPLEFIMSLQGYLHKEDYKKMYRRRLAVLNKLESEGRMEDENLKAFFEGGAKLFYANGGVKIQSVFFGIFDNEKLEMREGEYEWSDKMAAQVLEELKKEDADFMAIAKKYEDINGFERPAESEYLTRNDLRTFCGETLKSIITEGYSVADDIFYNAKEGDIVGPLKVYRGELGNPVLKGVYIYKVIGYQTMFEPRIYFNCKPTVRDDYLELTLITWSSKLMQEADVTVTQRS